MKLAIENNQLASCINFLSNIKAKGKKARTIVKTKKLLIEQFEDYMEAQQMLVEEFGERDADGNLIPKDPSNPTGNKVIRRSQENRFWEEHRVLAKEKAEIEGGTYVNHINDLKEILENFDEEISGLDAEAYDALLDAIEEGGES